MFENSRTHGTSAGFAVSYLGSAVRPTMCVDSGVVFSAGFGKRRQTLICERPEEFNVDLVDAFSVERIVSPAPLSVPGWKETIRKEYAVQSLDTQHLTAKERYNEIVWPIKKITEQGFVLQSATLQHLEQLRFLWKTWCEMKLSDPKVHKISFTAARYWRCIEDALNRLYPNATYVLVNVHGAIAACRVLSLAGTRAFDLAFMSDREVKGSARAMQYLSLRDLFVRGIKEVNFGESTGKGLTHFKTRFAATIVLSYQYDPK